MILWTLATRFLFRSGQLRALSLFSAISVLGIAFSVMLFLLIDTVMNGFSLHLAQTLQGFDAPLVLEFSAAQADDAKNALATFQKKHPSEIAHALPSRQFDGLIQVPDEPPSGVKVRSITPDVFDVRGRTLKVYWNEGFDQESFLREDNLILVGQDVYKRLPFLPGDDERVTITHPFADLGPTGEVEPREAEFRIAGIFTTGSFDFDAAYVLLSDRALNTLAEPQMLAHQIFLFPAEGLDPLDVQAQWRHDLATPVGTLRTWLDRNENLFKAMRLEKVVFTMLFLIVVLISCFNLAGVIAIFGMSKAQDAAVLKTLGLSEAKLRRVHMIIAALLGAVGATLGIAFSLIAVAVIQRTGLLVTDAYKFSDLALEIDVTTFLVLFAITPLLAALIAYWPARRVSRRDITEVLRLS